MGHHNKDEEVIRMGLGSLGKGNIDGGNDESHDAAAENDN